MTAIFAYITTGSHDEARRIAHALVEEGLAAGANLIDGVRSVYRWKGRIEEAAEVIVVAKTRDDLLASLTERVGALHSYDCPCIVGLPVTGGHRDYLDWVVSETRDAGG